MPVRGFYTIPRTQATLPAEGPRGTRRDSLPRRIPEPPRSRLASSTPTHPHRPGCGHNSVKADLAEPSPNKRVQVDQRPPTETSRGRPGRVPATEASPGGSTSPRRGASAPTMTRPRRRAESRLPTPAVMHTPVCRHGRPQAVVATGPAATTRPILNHAHRVDSRAGGAARSGRAILRRAGRSVRRFGRRHRRLLAARAPGTRHEGLVRRAAARALSGPAPCAARIVPGRQM